MAAISAFAPSIAGFLFGISWLIWIDGVAFAATEFDRSVDGAQYVPGVLQTLSLFMLNTVRWEAVTESQGLAEEGGGRLAKAWVFAAFCCAFGGLLGSLWILVAESRAPSWPGSADPALKGLLQNVVCFAASLLFRASRTKSDE